jgi:guanyl-specific ribonuclease Sa
VLTAASTLLAVALLSSACTSGADGGVATVTNTITVDPSSGTTTSRATTSAPSSGSSAVSGSTVTRTGTSSSVIPPSTVSSVTTAPAAGSPYEHPQDGVALPDGFVPHKLKPGEHPPQFIVVSFDGVGWDEKWQYWFDIGTKVPFRFTGFLSGTYLLSDQTKTIYHPPFYKPGSSQINWNTAADLPVQIANLNHALATGNEIGTHFNGHFCQGAGLPSGGNNWTKADWNTELDQFFSLLKNYRVNNTLGSDVPQLGVTAGEVLGERTPCLEGKADALFPALTAHHMIYDSSFTKRGISWPKQSPKYQIWQIGMAEFPIHGTLPSGSPVAPGKRTQHVQITMDYNFWYSQRGATSADAAGSAADSQQVLDTYKDMYNATFNGNRAPLILGNHFNSWNNNAYSDAIGNFVLQTCGQPDTQCVPFQDLIAWMLVQDPTRLAQLQAQDPEMGSTQG